MDLKGDSREDGQKYGASERLSVYSLSRNGTVLGEKIKMPFVHHKEVDIYNWSALSR